jgi:hypothetical protein
MTTPMPATDRRTEPPTMRDLSRSVAHLDIALLLGTGGLGTAMVVAARRSQTARRLALALLAGVAPLAGLALRLGRRSGVTDAEVQRGLPGDDLLTHPQLTTDRGVTIQAPVAAVWPWVVQMGYHRGGWYTNPRLDKLLWHIDNPSLDHVEPAFQALGVGSTVPDGPPGTAFFTVAAIEPLHHIVYLDATGSHIPGVTFTWAFVLEPAGDDGTRLLVRARAAGAAGLLARVLLRLLLGPGDFVMISQTMGGIKARAERAP